MTSPAVNSIPEQGRNASPRRATRWLLVGSLALNAFFIAGGISAFLRHGPHPQIGVARIEARPGIVGFIDQKLPPDRKRIVRAEFARHQSALAPLRGDLQVARKTVLAALEAEPFDKARFLDAQNTLLAAEQQMRRAQGESLSDILAMLTPDERRAFLAWRAANPPPPHGGRVGQ